MGVETTIAKQDFETVMVVRKGVFARAKLFELWGKFELNFTSFLKSAGNF